MKEQLSPYAEKCLVSFLDDVRLQAQITEMAAWHMVSNIDDLVELCLTMFMANVDAARLDPNDLSILKSKLRDIRSMDIRYPINTDVLPEPTDNFIKTKVEERIHAGYSKVIDRNTGKIKVTIKQIA